MQRVLLSGGARINFASAAVTFDGNSLVYGVGSDGGAGRLPNQLAALAPISGLLSISNVGISSQTINNMRGIAETTNGVNPGSTSDVDGSWVAGKTNVLIVWEGTNSIFNSAWTGLQAASQMASYCAERQAVHPWRIVLVTTLPRYQSPPSGSGTIASLNAELAAYNAYLLANYRAMGAAAVVDVRQAGSPFALPDYTLPSFETSQLLALWSTGDGSGVHIHLQNAGYAYVASLIAPAIARLQK